MIPVQLQDALYTLVATIPGEILKGSFSSLDRTSVANWRELKHVVQANVPPNVRQRFGDLIDLWQQHAPELTPRELLGALQVAAYTFAREQQRQNVELVWTGPESRIPVRRTEQALLQVIDAAQTDLLIVSFAVYDIPEIVQALEKAQRRGVVIDMVVETLDRHNPEPQSRLHALRSLRDKLHIYHWPLEKRTRNERNAYGLLHVKCALADQRSLFLSSANLTHYAMNLNIEMGVLIHGGSLPVQVYHHFQQLIEQQILETLTTEN